MAITSLEEVQKNLNLEKSDTMEERYKLNPDTWGNKNRYNKILKPLIHRIEDMVSNINWIDIGSGSGMVAESISKESKSGLEITGCDISPSAIKYGTENKLLKSDSFVLDLNTLEKGSVFLNWNVLSLIDVMYYLGGEGHRDWHTTAEMIWDNIKPGSILVVADSLIRFQYREIFKKFEGCKIIDEYIEYVEPLYITEKGVRRYLKIKIYQKI